MKNKKAVKKKLGVRSKSPSEIKELRQKIAFLNSVIDNIPNMVFLKEAKSLKFVRFNRAGEKLLGYTEKDLLGKNDYDFFPKDEADFFTKKDREVLKSKDVFDITEEPIQTRKKGLRILHTKKCALYDLNGKPAYLLGISEDITDRKDAEAKLAESEKRLSLALQASQIGTWCWQVQADKLIWDENSYKLFGVTPKKFTPNYASVMNLICPRDQERIKKTLTSALLAGKEYNQEFNIFLSNKSERGIAVRSMIDRNEVGEAVSLTGICWDITEQQQKHALEVKSEMISMVSHELRTPLHTIKESISVILEGLTGSVNSEQTEVLETARLCIDRLTRLINNVLDFQKMDAGILDLDYEKTDLNQLIREIAGIELPNVQKKNLSIALELCAGELTAEIDTDKMIQVLTNLIHNAVKFTERGAITVKTRKEQGFAKISVRDTGIGFSQADADKIFREFGQTESSRKFFPQGTGLGLAISKKIVLQHQGKIWAESKKPLGSVFHVLLPLKQGAHDSPTA